MNMILFEVAEVGADGVATLHDERSKHIVRVLGAKPGDSIRAGIIDGPTGSAKIEQIAGYEVSLRFESSGETPPVPAIDLLLAMPRPKVMKRLWAQFAALGVGRIILTNASKVERNYFDTHVLEESFYRPLLIEGLQQARDTRLPRVTIHRQFRPLVEDELATLSDATTRIVADPSGSDRIGEATKKRNGDRVLLAVGPEGGWIPFELELLKSHGFTCAGIGPRILRADTACIALLALVHDAMR